MEYPKKLMSISELVALGYSRGQLRTATHHELATRYLVATANKGKFYIDTDEFEKVRNIVLRGK